MAPAILSVSTNASSGQAITGQKWANRLPLSKSNASIAKIFFIRWNHVQSLLPAISVYPSLSIL